MLQKPFFLVFKICDFHFFDISHFASFPVIFLPLCLPVVTPRCGFRLRAGTGSRGTGSKSSGQPLRLSTNARALNARARVGGKAGLRTSTQRRGSATGEYNTEAQRGNKTGNHREKGKVKKTKLYFFNLFNCFKNTVYI